MCCKLKLGIIGIIFENIRKMFVIYNSISY